MKNIIHIHEVLNFLASENRDFSRQELLSQMTELFGQDVNFTTCGDHILNPEQAIEFMESRDKISIDNGRIRINKNLETCE